MVTALPHTDPSAPPAAGSVTEAPPMPTAPPAPPTSSTADAPATEARSSIPGGTPSAWPTGRLLGPLRRHPVATSVVVLGVAFLFVGAQVRTWTGLPTGDTALISLHASEVGGPRSPLVGPYSRYGWNHPGPMLFWVVAAGQHLAGAAGERLAVLALEGACAVAAVALAVRRRPVVGGLLGAAVLVALLADGGSSYGSTWNPYVLPIPLLACAVGCWLAATDGDAGGLLLGVVAGSFVAQSHVAGVPLVAAVGTVAVALRIVLRRGRPRIRWWWTAAGAAVAVALWAPPVWQQLTGRDGNLAAIWDYFTSDHRGGTVGPGDAFAVLVRQLALPAPWMKGRTHTPPQDVAGAPGLVAQVAVGLLLAVLVLLVVRAVRRGDRGRAGLGVLALGLVAVSWLATTRITGEPFEYLVHWWWAVSMLLWVATVDLVLGEVVTRWTTRPAARRPPVGRHGRHVRRRTPVGRAGGAALGTAVVLLVVVLIGGIAVRSTSVVPDDLAAARAATSLVRQVEPHLVAGRAYRLRWADPYDFGSGSVGLLVALRERGFAVAVPPREVVVLGPRYVVAAREARPTLTVVSSLDPDLPAVPAGARLLARFDPLDRAERAEYDRVFRRVAGEQGRHAPITDVEGLGGITAVRRGAGAHEVARLAALQRLGPRFVVYETPAPPRPG